MASLVQGNLCCLSTSALGGAVAMLSSLPSKRKSRKAKALDLVLLLARDRINRQQESSLADLQDYPPPPVPAAGWAASKAAALSRAESRQAINLEDCAEANVAVVGGWEGFSMEDARKRNEELKSDFKDLTPKEVLDRLQKGNARFWTGNAARPESSAFERRALIMQQFPFTAVLGCSDSRVPVEVIFDQSLGDMFVVRVAGNCLGTATTASLQYAVHHLKVKVLMVMGHEGCGAVKAAQSPAQQINKEPEALSSALKMMKAGLDEERLANIYDGRSHDREAVVTNIRRQVEGLCKDAAIMQKVANEELIIVGCFYEISSGIVDFFMEVTDTPLNQKLVLQEVKAPALKKLELPFKNEEVSHTYKDPVKVAPDEILAANLLKPDDSKVERLEKELQAARIELSQTKQKFHESRQQDVFRGKELEALKYAAKDAQAKHEKEIENLHQQLRAMQKEIAESQATKHKEAFAAEKANLLQVEIENLRRQSQADLQNLRQVEAELASSRAAAAQHKGEVESLQQYLFAVQKELSESRASKSNKADLQHVKVETELAASREAAATASAEITCLEAELLEAKQFEAKVSDYIAQLRAEYLEAKKFQEEAPALQADLKALRESEAKLAEENSRLLADLRRLQVTGPPSPVKQAEEVPRTSVVMPTRGVSHLKEETSRRSFPSPPMVSGPTLPVRQAVSGQPLPLRQEVSSPRYMFPVREPTPEVSYPSYVFPAREPTPVYPSVWPGNNVAPQANFSQPTQFRFV